jgi:hypothetical protein
MNQEKIKVKVPDRNGNYNNWTIYGETKYTYKIYAECNRSYISELYKSDLYIDENDNWCLYTDIVKHPFSLMPNVVKAEFCWIKLDE